MWLLGCIGQTWILPELPQSLFQTQPCPILLWDLCKDTNSLQIFSEISISWKVGWPVHLWFCQYKCYPDWCQMELCSPMSSKIAKKVSERWLRSQEFWYDKPDVFGILQQWLSCLMTAWQQDYFKCFCPKKLKYITVKGNSLNTLTQKGT